MRRSERAAAGGRWVWAAAAAAKALRRGKLSTACQLGDQFNATAATPTWPQPVYGRGRYGGGDLGCSASTSHALLWNYERSGFPGGLRNF